MNKNEDDSIEDMEIDVEGFKFVLSDYKEKDLIPEYFNTPFITPWEITRQCNLKCLQCLNNSGTKHPHELTHEQKIRVAHELVEAKIYRACLSGGEPILCESFWEIANILKEGKVLCNTITNGLFVNEENAKRYVDTFNVIQVSIDGATAKTHDMIRGKKGSFEKAVNAARMFADYGARVSIANVGVHPNVGELNDLVDLAADIGATIFRCEPVKLAGRAAINKELLTPTAEDLKLITSTLEKKKEEYEGKMAIDIIPAEQSEFLLAKAGFPPIVCYISPTGTCAPNPVFPFSGGSLKDKSFQEVWDEIKVFHNNPEYIKIAHSVKSNEDFLKLDHIPYVEGELHDR